MWSSAQVGYFYGRENSYQKKYFIQPLMLWIFNKPDYNITLQDFNQLWTVHNIGNLDLDYLSLHHLSPHSPFHLQSLIKQSSQSHIRTSEDSCMWRLVGKRREPKELYCCSGSPFPNNPPAIWNVDLLLLLLDSLCSSIAAFFILDSSICSLSHAFISS